MNSMLVNWKTSLAGLVLILVGIMGALLNIHIPGFTMDSGLAITTGIGLLMAKDAVPPAVAKVVMVAFLMALFLPIPAQAADNLPFPIKAPVASTPCTIQSCSGFYVGMGLSGSGTNADIVGSGINNSVFAAGGVIDVHGGYQFWNGTFFAAFEGGLGNTFQPNQPISALGAKSLTGYEIVKLGMGLQGLFTQPSGVPTAGQAPTAITIPNQIASMLMSPYFVTGAMQRNGVSQWITGAGAEFLLASHWNLDLRYVYGAPINSASPLNGAPALNLVTLGLNYHF